MRATSLVSAPSRSSLSYLMLPLVAALCAASCSPATRYYTLSPIEGARPPSVAAGSALVAVGPVSLPDYVDRVQIVVRTGPNTVEQASFDRWGGSLRDMLPRQLVADLASRLPADHFVEFPRGGDLPFDYRVAIDISRFDVTDGGEATIAAGWRIRGPSADETLAVRETTASVQGEGGSYEQRVAALSRALGVLADAIAAELATLPRGAGAH